MNHVVKLITIGEAGGGKTTLLSCFCDQVKPTYYQPTIGVEFNVLYMERGSKKLKLQFWDTAGQECFAPIIRSYYKNIAGIFYVVDLTSRKSIKKINYWLDEINKNKNCDIKIIVIGNKCDSTERIITKEEMIMKFHEKNLIYMETSALNNINTKLPLYKMVDYIIDTYDFDNHPGISSGARKNILVLKNRNTCSYAQQTRCCTIS